ncbi:MAG TPA: hypothetical protein VN756_03775 [Solirubrobacterales bacterium]|nr:hypothetical protein [Solirubrobacterales bacterium]
MRGDEAHVVLLLTVDYTARISRLQGLAGTDPVDWDEVARISNEYEERVAQAVEEVRAARPWWRRWF